MLTLWLAEVRFHLRKRHRESRPSGTLFEPPGPSRKAREVAGDTRYGVHKEITWLVTPGIPAGDVGKSIGLKMPRSAANRACKVYGAHHASSGSTRASSSSIPD